jgi:NhaP-type Na+/H+ or K+/H+ antiporter
MEPALAYLASIAAVIAIGIVLAHASAKLRVPNALLLVLAGIALSQIRYNGKALITLPREFIFGVAALALAMTAFDASSRVNIKDIAGKNAITVLQLALNMTVLAFAAYHILGMSNVHMALVFGALMSSTSAIKMLRGKKQVTLLEKESLFNTPLMMLILFIVLELMAIMNTSGIGERAVPFLQHIAIGIGTGILVGIIMFKAMRAEYCKHRSPIAMIAATVLAFIIAENIGGMGVLAVITLGLMFGNIYIKEKWKLHEFSGMLANSIEILVFVLLGIAIAVPISYQFILKSVLLFAIYLAIRFAAVMIAHNKEKHKLLLTLAAPQGIGMAAVALMLAATGGAGMMLGAALALMVYSLITSKMAAKLIPAK